MVKLFDVSLYPHSRRIFYRDVQRHVEKKLGSSATDVRKFVGRSPTRFVIYLISLSLSKPVLKLFCFEFFSYREEKGGFFFIDRFFFLFFLGDRSDSIYFNGASSCSLTIRLRMAFHGIMGHSLWKFLKELSFLEGGKSFRRIYIYTRYIKHDSLSLSIKLSKNSFACVNFYACIPMNRSWRAKNLWELCMSITYDRIFKISRCNFYRYIDTSKHRTRCS